MTTATIIFDDQQQAEVEKQLAELNTRKAADGQRELTLDEYCTLELVHAIGLSKSVITAKEAAALAEKYAKLSDADKAEIKAAIEAKPVDVKLDAGAVDAVITP